jgi:hypothetical protein
MESKDGEEQEENVYSRKSKIKAVADDVATRIQRALIKTMSDDPEISSTSGGFSGRHWRVGIERYKKLGYRTLYISNYFADNLVPNIQEELGQGTVVKFVTVQFGQNMLLRNGARSMSHLFKYYELAFANKVTVAIARDMCQVNFRNTILSKKCIIEYAMANDGKINSLVEWVF